MTELILLKIQNLIAEKNLVTATANRDLAVGGEWRQDYPAWHGQLEAEIQNLFATIPTNQNLHSPKG